MAALGALSESEAAAVRLGHDALGTATSQPTAIVPPGWDDIIVVERHIPPTRDQWREYYRARREGRASDNPGSVDREAARRERAIQRMQTSPTPQWSRDAGSILTALDNVQDALATAAALGRLVIKPLPILHTILGVPLSALLGGANVLRTLTTLGMLLMILYGWLCRGPREALAAGIPVALMGRGPKQLISQAGALSPRARRWVEVKQRPMWIGQGYELYNRLGLGRGLRDRARQFMSGRFTIYNWIEGAQVSKDVFGYGLQFGGIVGWVTDSAFGLERRLRGEQVTVKTPRRPEVYHAVFRDALRAVPTAALHELHAAAGVLAMLPFVLDPERGVPDQDVIEALIAAYHAYDLLRRPWSDLMTDEIVRLARDDEWTPPSWSLYATADAIALAVPDSGLEVPHWPVAGAPRVLGGLELAEAGIGALERWWDYLEVRSEMYAEDLALHALTFRVWDRAMLAWHADALAARWSITDDLALAECLADSYVWLNTVRDPVAAQRFIDAYIEQRARTGRSMLRLRELRRMERETGAELIPMLVPGTVLGQQSEW